MLEQCKSNAFDGMPGPDLLYTIKQLHLFSTLCEDVNTKTQISGSYPLATAAHKPACVDDSAKLQGFSASAVLGKNPPERGWKSFRDKRFLSGPHGILAFQFCLGPGGPAMAMGRPYREACRFFHRTVPLSSSS